MVANYNNNFKERYEYDDIVIGSGIGGMTCAAYLAKQGRKVIVFEKQAKPGGCCVSYMRDGFSFAPSVHWLSFCGENQLVTQVVKELGIANRVQFAVFDPLVRFVSETSDITLSFDIEKLKDTLKSLYPQERKGIDGFFQLSAELINELNVMLDQSLHMVSTFDRIKFGMQYVTGKYKVTAKIRKIPAYKVLRSYFKNENLIHLFYIMGPGDQDAEILPILARIGWALDKNYYYIKEGNNSRLSDTFAYAVTQHGGEITYNCPIEKILIKDNRAIGVLDINGRVFYGRNIISNIDAFTTYFKLIGKENLSSKFIKFLEKRKPYSSSFAVNLGVDMNLAEMGFSGESITFLPSNKLEDISGYDPDKCKITIQFRSLRDKTLAPNGKNTVMISARLPYDYQNIWTTGGTGIRGPSYYDLKNQVADRLIASAEKIIPGLSRHILVKDIATPLTFERFTGNSRGAIMGWQENNVSLPKLPLAGLYQVGHWNFPGGSIFRVMASGKNVSQIILKQSKK